MIEAKFSSWRESQEISVPDSQLQTAAIIAPSQSKSGNFYQSKMTAQF
jgi:hypothetical protein